MGRARTTHPVSNSPVIGTKIEVRRPHPSFRRTPDSCSAGTVPHPVPGCCRQLGLGTAEPFSSLGVPVATGMSDCYENSTRPPRYVVPSPEEPAPYPDTGTWGGVGLDHANRRRHFHPLMWPSQGHGDSGESRNPEGGVVGCRFARGRFQGSIEMKDSERYVKLVEWSDEDQCYIGTAPGLIYGGCHGADEKEVFDELCNIVEEVIALYREDNKPLPSAE